MGLSGGTLDRTCKTRRERGAASTARVDERIAAQDVASPEDNLSGTNQALKEELAAVRAEQAQLHQAIFEAAQVQRRLCAPRELCWGEFEVAGEIFPVRHLSGDFFKVLDLGSVLGLSVVDIAGKGLSAGRWRARHAGSRRHADRLLGRCG